MFSVFEPGYGKTNIIQNRRIRTKESTCDATCRTDSRRLSALNIPYGFGHYWGVMGPGDSREEREKKERLGRAQSLGYLSTLRCRMMYSCEGIWSMGKSMYV